MIRPVMKADIPCCVEVIHRSFLTVADEFGITPENAPGYTAFAVSEERLLWQLSEERRPMFVCCGESIIGYYSLALSESECELNNLCVLPEYRGTGFGGELLAHAFESARSLGCAVMNISIVEENRRLRSWYERFGFVHTGTRKFDFFPFTCGYMTKQLQEAEA